MTDRPTALRQASPQHDVVPNPTPVTEAHAAQPGECQEGRGEVAGCWASPTDEISGCNFHGRCPLYKILDPSRQERCLTEDPELRVIDTTSAACHHVEQNTLQPL